MPRHKNQVNFDPNTKIFFRHLRKKPSQFRFLHWNQVKFDPPPWNQVNFNHISTTRTATSWNSIPHTKIKSISMHTLKPSQFWCLDTKIKLISTHTLKPSTFAPHTNQVNSDPTHWNKVNYDHPPKNEVNFDTNTETMSFSGSVILRGIHTGTCSWNTAAIRIT